MQQLWTLEDPIFMETIHSSQAKVEEKLKRGDHRWVLHLRSLDLEGRQYKSAIFLR